MSVDEPIGWCSAGRVRYPISITENFLLEPILHTFGVKDETSYAELHADHLEVSMGKWFHERIPFSEIASLAPSEWPWWGGLGVKLGHHGVGVVGSLDGVVNLKFKKPLEVRVLAQVSVEQMWVSLKDRDSFLQALAEATKLPISEHAKF
ncbi:MAG: hypothetical protein U0271_47690 [Polyangiaceae bacterium]